MSTLLEVDDLHVSFNTYAGKVQAVRGVSFCINKGETVAIVGESGCGKSVTAQAIVKLLPTPPAKISAGKILLHGEDLALKSEREMQDIRGKKFGMIFQDPMTSLNPTIKIGVQLTEGMHRHLSLSKKDVHREAIELLHHVGISDPEERMQQYPHQLSGGMRQRVMIAIAIACHPELLIADEPTTALDVTIQAQILTLLKQVQEQRKMSIMFITHDLGVVAGMCDRVIVMYAGKIVEIGNVFSIFQSPQHPYTKALLRAIPRLGMEKDKPLVPIHGSPPNLIHLPKGCAFSPRCDHTMDICFKQCPKLTPLESAQHSSACWQKEST